MFSILKDISTGALSVAEIGGFIMWMMGKSFWFWMAICIGAGMGYLLFHF